MGMKKEVALFPLLIQLVLLLSSSSSSSSIIVGAAGGGNSSVVDVSPFCQPNHPPRKLRNDVEKVLCTEWVKGSKTWKGAMTNAIKSLVEVAKASKPKAMSAIQGQINLFLEPASVSEPWLGNCSKAFDAYMDNEEHWLKLVRSGRDIDLSDAFQDDHFVTCRTMMKKGYPVPEIDAFDLHKSFRNIPLAIISTKTHGHSGGETAVKDESNNSNRFCVGNKEKDRAICQKWVYGARDWVEAVAKGMTAVIEIANSTKPVALDTIRARLAPLGVDPEPVVATCSQAFDAYVATKSSHIRQVEADPLMEDLANSPSDDDIASCIDALLEQANFSLPDINKFSKENSINRILSSIVTSRDAIVGDAGHGEQPTSDLDGPGSFVLDGPGSFN